MRKIEGENKSEWFKLAYTTTQSIDAIRYDCHACEVS